MMANGHVEDKLYLENLEEEVIQLGNVVTYKWLVRTLKVSANVAKRMLFEFVEKQKAAGVQLNVTYLVAGEKTKDGENVPVHEIQIVSSSRLEAVKARFDTITSLHVYGVHKAEIKDRNIFYAADYSPNRDAVTEIKNSCTITCQNVALRPANGTETVALPELPPSDPRDEKKPERLSEPKPQRSKESNPKSKTDKSICKKPVKAKGRSQGASLVGMFENMEKKRKATNANEDSKVTADKPDEEDEKLVEAVTQKESAKVPKKSQQIQRKVKKEQITEKPKEVREKRKAKTETTAKKRRRIIQMSDSSSEEDSEPESPIPTPYDSPEEDRKEEVEEEEEDEVVKIPSGRKSIHKRKLVNESGMDEDGFLVTQNKWEDGSGSENSGDENEDPIPKVKTEEPKDETKVTPKSKQVMLTNFFKKK